MADTPTDPTGGEAVGEKKMSKRAMEKELKKAKAKAQKAALRTEVALRAGKSETSSSTSKAPISIFAEGWLRKTYEARKCDQVRTRFPPEPNGFLHIGHAKAIAVNFGFAKYYDGICFLRFDDTNPEKEDDIYFKAIEDMVAWLGFKPYQITYSSDHFDRLYELAEELIKRDKAYVCHCSKTEVNMQRGGPDNKGQRFGCSHRSRPVEESLTEFRAMRDGKYKPGEAVLRMKQSIDKPEEGNPQMWDLAAYRVLEQNHHPRTGDKWKIYPTYDFTHCLCDAFEGITHSMCTSEFYLSRQSYDWLLEQLDMKTPGSDDRGPMQREYGRLNVAGTILSKRRITMLVNGTVVETVKADGTKESRKIPPAVRGWDDPRLFTLVAIRRRGVPAKALLQFVEDLGVTDALTLIQTYKFDSSIRKFLERTVPRLSLVLDPIKVVIEDLDERYAELLKVPFDPKAPEGPSRTVTMTKEIFIDRSDFKEDEDPNFFRLSPGKIVGLLHVPFPIKATGFEKDSSGRVNLIKAVKVELSDTNKPRAYIHWCGKHAINVTARQYNALFSVEDPNSLDWKGTGWADALNPNSELVHANALLEEGFNELTKGHHDRLSGASDDIVRFQAVRTAYFAVDVVETNWDKIVLNQIVTLKEDSSKGK